MTLIKDLIDIPLQVHKGDFVLKLTEGVQHARETLDSYVVTSQLVACFDRALNFINSALTQGTSKAAYLHGSFGAGKSHFMAVLHLVLQHDPLARTHEDLAPVCSKHPWIVGKKFLLVPFHLIGARSIEAAVFGGYVQHVRRLHPDAPHPGVYQSEAIFANAAALQQAMGDAAFFGKLNEGQGGGRWGKLSQGWNVPSYGEAVRRPPNHPDRVRLVGAIVKNLLPALEQKAGADGESYVSLDEGLSILSLHARSLGYDALILFLDELILWLASHAADLPFVHREGQKLSKLVEAQRADRPVPIVSFVARQRDLRELVGESVTGADRLNFSDALKHWEGRFETITLEDRNLPEIAQKRVLKPSSPDAKVELDRAFERTAAMKNSVMEILLTKSGDRATFRQVYPFSPALVDALVAVSSALQRERTALKIMLELLVSQRETLELGQLIPVGDLFDVIEGGDEAFSGILGDTFENARRLYRQRLLPLLEESNGVEWDAPAAALDADPSLRNRWKKLFNEARLVKTLLLAAIVPEVESLKNLNGEKLAALNHGTIKTQVPGGEASLVTHRVRALASQVGEIKQTGSESKPFFSIHLTGVDIEGILQDARREDNQGNRRACLRRLVHHMLGVAESEEPTLNLPLVWKGTSRVAQVVFARIRELSDDVLESENDHWKVVLDYPFDEGHSPHDAVSRFERWQVDKRPRTRTIGWVPSYFSASTLRDLGTLFVAQHILTGDRFRTHVTHLAPEQREVAKRLLENRRDALTSSLKTAILQAYGLSPDSTSSLDPAYLVEGRDHFLSLWPDLEPRPPVAVDLGSAVRVLASQALEVQFPGHPSFGGGEEIRVGACKQVWSQVERAAADLDHRTPIDRALRQKLADIAVPLQLGTMNETHFVVGRDWLNRFSRRLAEKKQPAVSVKQLYEWMDDPSPTGLPPHLRNLVVLLFARQSQRTFVHYGQPKDPDLDAIRPEMELREQALPDETLWTAACDGAAELLGRNPARMRSAANVAALASELEAWAADRSTTVGLLPDTLRRLCEIVGLAEADCTRLRTARQARSLVKSVQESADDAAIEAFVGASEGLNLPLVRASIDGAGTVLQEATPELMRVLRRCAERKEKPIGELREVLAHEEGARKLQPELSAAYKDGIKIITDPPPPPAPVPPPLRVRQPVGERHGTGLSSDEVRRLLQELEGHLDDGVRVDLSWTVWRE